MCVHQTFSEPSSEKLLPDLLPPPYQRPYTLVLELNDLLIHTAYDVSDASISVSGISFLFSSKRSVGWKYQKRPGVDALLVGLFDFYEIVVFTSETAMVCTTFISCCRSNVLFIRRGILS